MPTNLFFSLILLCSMSVLRASDNDISVIQACEQWLTCLKSLRVDVRNAYLTREEKIQRTVVAGSIMRIEYYTKNNNVLSESFLQYEYNLLQGLLLDTSVLYDVLKQYPVLQQKIGISVVDNITIGNPVLQKPYANYVYVSDMSS